jgi:hypothetical protein
MLIDLYVLAEINKTTEKVDQLFLSQENYKRIKCKHCKIKAKLNYNLQIIKRKANFIGCSKLNKIKTG